MDFVILGGTLAVGATIGGLIMAAFNGAGNTEEVDTLQKMLAATEEDRAALLRELEHKTNLLTATQQEKCRALNERDAARRKLEAISNIVPFEG